MKRFVLFCVVVLDVFSATCVAAVEPDRFLEACWASIDKRATFSPVERLGSKPVEQTQNATFDDLIGWGTLKKREVDHRVASRAPSYANLLDSYREVFDIMREPTLLSAELSFRHKGQAKARVCTLVFDAARSVHAEVNPLHLRIEGWSDFEFFRFDLDL